MNKIFLVEDDQFFQKFYSVKLKEAGYDVVAASDGEEALIKLPQIQPNLILLDLIMPKKDGFEVLQTLSQSPTYKSIPVIVFSTLGNEQDIQKAMQLGAKDFINKGSQDFEVLKQKINLYLPHS